MTTLRLQQYKGLQQAIQVYNTLHLATTLKIYTRLHKVTPSYIGVHEDKLDKCDRICGKVPFPHTKFDPFYEL